MLREGVFLFQAFQKVCEENAERTAVFSRTESTYTPQSFLELYQKVLQLASFFESQGIKDQSHCALIMENSQFWIIAFWAVMKLNATIVPLNPQLGDDDLTAFLTHSESSCILTSNGFSERLSKIAERLTLPLFRIDTPACYPQVTAQEIPAPPINSPDRQVAAIVYTSGTIAAPKGVMLTHENFLSNVRSLQKLRLMIETDCLIAVLPFYHTYALTVNLLLPLLSGATLSFPAHLDIQEILECVKKTQVTVLVGVPRLFTLLCNKIQEFILKRPLFEQWSIKIILAVTARIRQWTKVNYALLLLPSLHAHFGPQFRFMISGGAPLRKDIAKSLYAYGFTIVEGYGLTETSPVLTFNLPHCFKIGSAGKALPDIDIQIHEPDDHATGEIIARGKNVMAGYYKDPALTEETLQNGWFYTGDIGTFDTDGFLYITGRRKELIVLSSGKKIIPDELEAHYGKSPFIAELCIFLTHTPDEKDILTAAILPHYEHFRSQGIGRVKERLHWEIENASRALPPYKRIHDFIIINEALPKTVLGKLQRYEIARKYAQRNTVEHEEKDPALTDDDARLMASAICRKAMAYLSEKLKKTIHLDDNLELELGLDSLEQIGLFLDFEKITGIHLEGQELLDVFTVRDVFKKLIAYTGPADGETDSHADDWQKTLQPPFDPQIENAISLAEPPLKRIIQRLFMFKMKLFARGFLFLSVEGKENIPRTGPVLLCPNHTSFFDGPLMATALPMHTLYETYFLGYSAYFDHPSLRWCKKLLHLVSIDAGSQLTQSLQLCSYILRNNRILCMFPEGMRSSDGTVQEFKRGVGILVKELNVPVIPVYIDGAYQAWPAHRDIPHMYPVTITFGKPISPQELLTPAKSTVDSYKNIVDNLREAVIQLGPQNPSVSKTRL